MTRSMQQTMVAACAALGLALVGCGGGSTPNPSVAPTITSVPPTTATIGVPFAYTVTVEGMTPVAFAKVSGPADFEIHPTSGVVTWTPTAEGTASIELSASNLAGTDTQAFDVEVEGIEGPVFTTDPPTDATVAAPYAYDPAVVASGDVTWSAPTAPEGLTIDPATGAVRWTPTSDQVGDQQVVIRATDDADRATDQSFVVTVVDTGGPAVITSTPPDRVIEGEVWSYPATAAGAPTVVWSLPAPSGGTPADGVVIVDDPPEGASVVIEWNTAGVSPGTYTIAVQVENGLGDPNVQELSVTVEARPPAPIIDLVTVEPPEEVFVGTLYEYDVNLVPGTESDGVVFSLVGETIPPDLAVTIDETTGLVSFTASETNGERSYEYSVRAENVVGDSDEVTIDVDAVFPPVTPILTVTPATDFTLEVGESFPGAAAEATGNPAPALSTDGVVPDFMEFDPLTGDLSASSTKPAPVEADIGSTSFDIVATNTEGSDRVTINVTVIAAPPAVDSITPAAGRRQSDVPIVVRGAGFVSAAAPTIRLELGGYTEALTTTYEDEGRLSAVVPTDVARPPGVYDVVVDQGSTTTLAKRFTVTAGPGTDLSGTLATDRTLTAADSPHIVVGDVRVESGATLTVEPGAVVMFPGDTNRRIDVGIAGAGAIVADGGEPGVGDQVVFTRLQDAGGGAPTGYYQGLRFGANNISAVTRLRNVVVEFGGRRNGSTDQGAVDVRAASAPVILDSIVRESLNHGLYAQAGAGSDTVSWFDRNQLTANGQTPINIGSDDVATLGADLDLVGNIEDVVFVRGSTVSRPSSDWTNYGVPFVLSAGLSVRGGAVLRLEAGTEMRFAAGQRLQVSTGGGSGEDGTLIAAGTPDAPIRMVADAGPWNGIRFDDHVQDGTVLRNVRVQGFSGSVSGGLQVDAGERVAIVERSLIQSDESGSVAVYMAGGARLASFENNVLDAEALSVDAPMAGFSDVLTTSNVYETPLEVRGSGANDLDITWSVPRASDASPQPIRPTGNIALTGGSWVIAAGNLIEMPLNGQLTATHARLAVDGTAGEPVVFAPAAGVAYWQRIRVRGAGSATSRITHANLDAAGGDPTLGPSTARAAIVVEAFEGESATPAISDTSITNSSGYGMVFGSQTHCNGACNDNEITGSRFAAVRLHANSVGRFGTGNALAGNNVSSTFGHDGVWVVGGRVDVSASWPANDVPYVVQGNSIEVRRSFPTDPIPALTIQPGAELRFASGLRLRFGEGDDGILDAQGTSVAPITFTSIDVATPTFWRGIDFNQGSKGSVLDHVVVSYGGLGGSTGNLNFRSGSDTTVGVATFSHADGYAAVVFAGAAVDFVGPVDDRVYELNGQGAAPGVGDPSFDCVRDTVTSTCEAR